MSDDLRWREVRALFEAIVDLPPTDREAVLATRCGTDAELRAEVESLLRAHDDPDHRLETSARNPVGLADIGEDDEGDLPPGTRIGPYRIERRLGSGGMGVVYRATRADGAFVKDVAIKVLHAGPNGAAIARRFRHERQLLASLAHPNIATLLDGGATEEGVPYFVMELVTGDPIDAYCDRRALGLDERLRLFLGVADAVQHAHQQLVVHRDLKPDNILVGEDGQPKLLDFGIAKVLHAEAHEGLTTVGVRPMTPRYASPEQVRGAAIGTPTDIYSLGVLLYELVTGTPPFGNASGLELECAIRDEMPQRPSDAARSHASARRWHQRLRGDVDAIVLMALRKEPRRRYQTVEQFARDVDRHLAGLPVSARPDTLTYRATKLIRRNRLAAAAALTALVVLMAGVVTTTWSARVARQQADAANAERERARAEASRTQRMNDFLKTVLALPDSTWHSPGEGGRHDMTIVDLLNEGGVRVDREFGSDPILAGDLHHTLGNTYRARGLFADAVRHYQRALALRRESFPEPHGKIAETLFFLGACELLAGRLQPAEQHYREAIAMARRLPAPDDRLPHMLRDLSGFHLHRGELDQAEQVLNEALTLFERQRGSYDQTVAFTLQSLSLPLRSRADFAGARRVLQRALDIQRRLPSADEYILGVEAELADLALVEYMLRDRVDDREPPPQVLIDGERTHRRVIERLTLTLGPDHPRLADPLIRQSQFLYYLHRAPDAERAARRALTIKTTKLEPEDVTRADALSVLATAVGRQGRHDEAERYFRRALQVASQSPNTCRAGVHTMGLANWLLERGRRAEGEATLRQALDLVERFCGPGGPDLMLARKIAARLAPAVLTK